MQRNTRTRTHASPPRRTPSQAHRRTESQRACCDGGGGGIAWRAGWLAVSAGSQQGQRTARVLLARRANMARRVPHHAQLASRQLLSPHNASVTQGMEEGLRGGWRGSSYSPMFATPSPFDETLVLCPFHRRSSSTLHPFLSSVLQA